MLKDDKGAIFTAAARAQRADDYLNGLQAVRQEAAVARYRSRKLKLYFRADAAFANPEVYVFLEAEGFKYAIRLPANQVLQESIAFLLKRPVGRPPNGVRRYHARFSYQAGTWDKPRRIGAVLVDEELGRSPDVESGIMLQARCPPARGPSRY